MGCGGSKGKSFESVINKPSFRESLVIFHSLQLSRTDLKKMYKVFTTMDIDGSGSITLAELLAHLDLPRTAYTEKIFSIFDDDGSGAIDFREFILSVWNYCTLTKINLDMFAFDLYDTDGSGELSPPEVLKLLQEIFGKEEMKTNIHAKSASAEIAKYQIRNENFDAIKFHNFMMYHQAMLFPSIQMQQALHKKVCGAGFWEKHTKQREARSNGVYVSLAHFLMLEDVHVSSNNSTVMAGSEAGGSGRSAPGPGPGLTATSGMAALKAQRARQAAVNKLKAQFVDPGNVSSQTIIGKNATFTESAKVRWVQSMAGVSDFLGSMKQKRKIGGHNKVHAGGSSSTISASTTSNGGSTGSILSTVGVDAPVHSIPKPGTGHGHDAHAKGSGLVSPKGREHEKEVSIHRRGSAGSGGGGAADHDPEVSHRSRHHHHHHTNNRATPSHEHSHHGHAHAHAHGQGHGHGHSHAHGGSAGSSIVTSPIVSPRDAHAHRATASKDESATSPTSQHSHGSSIAARDEHKRRGSGGGGAVATDQIKKKPTR